MDAEGLGSWSRARNLNSTVAEVRGKSQAAGAVASACGVDKMGDGERNVSIFDVGGGTFGGSLLNLKDGTVLFQTECAGPLHASHGRGALAVRPA